MSSPSSIGQSVAHRHIYSFSCMLPDFPPTFWSNETSGACKPEVLSVFIIKRCLFFPCIADKNFGAVNVDHTIYLYLIRQCCDVGSAHSAKFLRRPSHTLCRRHSHGHWRQTHGVWVELPCWIS